MITRLRHYSGDDYPTVNWSRHARMAELWLEIDERHKNGQPVADLLARVPYRVQLNQRWPRIDCVSMVPGFAVSTRARDAFESLEVPGMQFMRFRLNNEPFFLFYTERCIDCLDRSASRIEYFRPSPQRVKRIVQYAFVEERLADTDVFTVPEVSKGMFFWAMEIFVTAAAQAAIEASNLVGFRFVELTKFTSHAEP